MLFRMQQVFFYFHQFFSLVELGLCKSQAKSLNNKEQRDFVAQIDCEKSEKGQIVESIIAHRRSERGPTKKSNLILRKTPLAKAIKRGTHSRTAGITRHRGAILWMCRKKSSSAAEKDKKTRV